MKLKELLDRYEVLMARKDEIEAELKELRKEIEESLGNRTEAKVSTTFGTTWSIKKLIRRRETVNRELLRLELGERAERYIKVREYQVLDIRPSRRSLHSLIVVKAGA
jgi:chaperonin cofactor prefoldin